MFELSDPLILDPLIPKIWFLILSTNHKLAVQIRG